MQIVRVFKLYIYTLWNIYTNLELVEFVIFCRNSLMLNWAVFIPIKKVENVKNN